MIDGLKPYSVLFCQFHQQRHDWPSGTSTSSARQAA